MHTYFQNDSHLPEAYAVNCFLILYSFSGITVMGETTRFW